MIENEKIKQQFKTDLQKFIGKLNVYVSTDDGNWTVKGFIDVFKNIYTISSDTKIISKILEIHIFPHILQFADSLGYHIVLAEKQNWYPDLSFVNKDNDKIKFAVDLKTTYRDPSFPGHVNGFTLGSHGTYFKDRTNSKNIQFPYAEYSGHFCLGIIYTRVDFENVSETEIFQVQELQEEYEKPIKKVGERKVTTVKHLKSITSVIKDFDFFVAEKWEIASETQGSKNTANIGSITNIEDLKKGNGIFAKLGEQWFDEYWINYGFATMVKDGKPVKITKLKDFLDFKGRNDLLEQLVTKNTKKKGK
ncbi:MAG TPA: type II restriction endonuclease [Chitinophagaceae bacterium]|nr:type II restriction endonuclease [Chitinophagaceae bacterium]